MQKRRKKKAEQLPLTERDLSSLQTGIQSVTRPARTFQKVPSGNQRQTLCCGLCILAFVSVILFCANTSSWPKANASAAFEEHKHEDRPLSQFKSLAYAFSRSRIVGLYFAAAWCPMSTPVTEAIDAHLGPQLLPPPRLYNPTLEDPAIMSLVYVSSDRTEEAFMAYQKQNWIAVPFHSDDRANLKRYFRTCAKPEVEALGIDRRAEIPTLLILDGETRQLITQHGVEDLMEYQEDALRHWIDLQKLMRAMEEKF